jgi:hypothetical protein
VWLKDSGLLEVLTIKATLKSKWNGTHSNFICLAVLLRYDQFKDSV